MTSDFSQKTELPDFHQLLQTMVATGASDLHLATGAEPAMRIHGALYRQLNMPPVPPDWIEATLNTLSDQFDAASYAQQMSADFGVTMSGQRFRVNLFRHRGGDALVVRHLGSDFGDLRSLGLPAALERLTGFESGLVLVCGATGSGKSTTLASLINMINQGSRRHILTIEDPVEYLHQDQMSIVRQRELGPDTTDFASAMRAALREDPDVILVGEMRDLETMRAALTAAETGHLVLSTLHTGSAVGAISRLVGAFPADEQDAVRLRASQCLQAVLAQHLLPGADGLGRVPVVELMFMTTAIRHMIAANKLDQVYSAVESGAADGMCTQEQSLARLLSSGRLNKDVAMSHCAQPEELERLLRDGASANHANRGRSQSWR